MASFAKETYEQDWNFESFSGIYKFTTALLPTDTLLQREGTRKQTRDSTGKEIWFYLKLWLGTFQALQILRQSTTSVSGEDGAEFDEVLAFKKSVFQTFYCEKVTLVNTCTVSW